MGIDFGLGLFFAISGLLILIGLLPNTIDIIHQQWYETTRDFYQTYVLHYGMQLSSWLPIKAIAEVSNIFLAFVAAMFTFNIARVVINVVTGGGARA